MPKLPVCCASSRYRRGPVRQMSRDRVSPKRGHLKMDVFRLVRFKRLPERVSSQKHLYMYMHMGVSFLGDPKKGGFLLLSLKPAPKREGHTYICMRQHSHHLSAYPADSADPTSGAAFCAAPVPRTRVCAMRNKSTVWENPTRTARRIPPNECRRPGLSSCEGAL